MKRDAYSDMRRLCAPTKAPIRTLHANANDSKPAQAYRALRKYLTILGHAGLCQASDAHHPVSHGLVMSGGAAN
ncbi:MAG: hypothetical protein U0640_07670 [Phycisphaerales bacterium]